MQIKELDVNLDIAMDIDQLTSGGFYPLETFMGFNELDSVLDNMRLKSGNVWPIPIVFPKPDGVDIGDELLIKFQGTDFAKMIISEIFEYDLDMYVKKLYGTDSKDHPGVSKVLCGGNQFITGKIKKLVELSTILKTDSMTPDQVKEIIAKRGWKDVVGFHTRNVPHRAHEFLQKTSLEHVDGILLHPVVGSKKKGDFRDSVIMKAYEVYVKNYLPQNRTIFTSLLTYSRYAGPKEAVFTAIVRRNYGCTHFIVGRDHTGVKDFYGKYDSHKIFDTLGDVGIKIMKFREPYYCTKCKQITTSKTCPHKESNYSSISGGDLRKSIIENGIYPDTHVRREVFELLKKIKDLFVD